MAKNFILTIDYELHLGNTTGSVFECMIEPTRRLMEILDRNQSKMTVFWDILHYYKLLELQDKYPVLKDDCRLIENQVKKMYEKGHDIQLHIHPHWLDAQYINDKWIFQYSRFSLKCLQPQKDKTDINTIYGCIYQCKQLLQNFMNTFAPEYQVSTFRAGGYLIEPFSLVQDALIENGITIDSSVCPGMSMEIVPFCFDFRGYPSRRYFVMNDLKKVAMQGKLTEYPITTVSIPIYYKIYFRLLFRLKYVKFLKELKGSGSCNSVSARKQKWYERFLFMFIRKEVSQLTPDVSFKEKINYLISRSPEDSVMILHPKFLNTHTYWILEDKIKKNQIYFQSIALYEQNILQEKK